MTLILFFLLVCNSAFSEQDWSGMATSAGGMAASYTNQMVANQQARTQVNLYKPKLLAKGITDECADCTGVTDLDSIKTGEEDEGTCDNPKGGWIEGAVKTVVSGSDHYWTSIKRVPCSGKVICAVNSMDDPASTKEKPLPPICKTACTDCCASLDELKVCKGVCTGVGGVDLVEQAIVEKAELNKTACDTFLSLKQSASMMGAAIVDLAALATQLGAALLKPGCDSACGDLSPQSAQVQCLCSTTGRDGKPCLNSLSNECKNANKVSCSDQMKDMTFGTSTERSTVLYACECGKRNDVDTTGNWHLNDKGSCVNKDNNNNFNGNNNNGPPTIKYDDGPAYVNSNGDGSDNNGSSASNGNTSKAPSGAVSASSPGAGAGLGGAGNGNGAKDKTKPDMAGQTGHGSGKGSNPMLGGSDGGGGGGAKGDLIAKKKAAAKKEIAKADGEDLFKLVTVIYKGMVDANALDSTGKLMKKLNKKVDKKSVKKQKVKKA